MTSTTDTAEHPDVAEISDLTEGLLPPSRTADVRRHLDECELCADVHASLEEIRGLLGTLPGPPRMPDDSPAASTPPSPRRRCWTPRRPDDADAMSHVRQPSPTRRR